jgi:hypothetical protein
MDNQPQPDQVPFPTRTGPRMVGAMPEPNGRQLQQTAQVAQAVSQGAQQAVASLPSDYYAARVRLEQLQRGAEAGLFDAASFVAEIIGNYQQHYQQTTGQRIGYRDALEQVVSLISAE